MEEHPGRLNPLAASCVAEIGQEFEWEEDLQDLGFAGRAAGVLHQSTLQMDLHATKRWCK